MRSIHPAQLYIVYSSLSERELSPSLDVTDLVAVAQSVMWPLSASRGIPVVCSHDRELLNDALIPVLIRSYIFERPQLIHKTDSRRFDDMMYDR